MGEKSVISQKYNNQEKTALWTFLARSLSVHLESEY